LTIIVGVKCTDGLVIGADSIAASASGTTPIMQIESNDKIKILKQYNSHNNGTCRVYTEITSPAPSRS
jgi:hypothetical protein